VGGGVSEVDNASIYRLLWPQLCRASQHVGPFQVFQAGGHFAAPVFDLTLWRRYRSAQIGVEAGRAQEVTVREESVMLVVSQYLGSQRRRRTWKPPNRA